MARKPRFDKGGHTYHVTQRGNNRRDCFFAERDYRFYLECMADSARRYDVAVHAYVLMTNHVHLLLTPTGDGAMSRFMQNIGRRYVRYINDSYERSGTLWEGRYHSEVVNVERHLLSCYQYIEMNPVRAGMVERPSDYVWSSARWHGLGEENSVVTDHELYLRLGSGISERISNYRALFKASLEVGSE